MNSTNYLAQSGNITRLDYAQRGFKIFFEFSGFDLSDQSDMTLDNEVTALYLLPFFVKYLASDIALFFKVINKSGQFLFV